MTGLTLYEKLWRDHLIERTDDGDLLYVDRHLIHEVSSPVAFASLRAEGRPVRRPELTTAFADHNVPTQGQEQGLAAIADPESRLQLETMEKNLVDFGVPGFDMGDPANGIVHVVAPERGMTQPGMLVVCSDSHTSTHGAFGALAFGVGTSEAEHVLASQAIRTRKNKTLRVTVEGELAPHVTAKDVALAVIVALGGSGGAGHAIEFAGSTVRGFDMEARMTLCNMAIEAGARCGLVAPDEVTIDYLRGLPDAPQGAAFEAAASWWRTLPSDPDAVFDREISLDAGGIAPMTTWGTTPAQAIPVDGHVPRLADIAEADRPTFEKALRYMGLTEGQPIAGERIDVVFIGSCTNARISDLRAAAAVLDGRRVAPHVRMLVVPGSGAVRLQAEAEGLDRVFLDAGAEWRQPGCSMCVGLNADRLAPGQRCASTSNRNFEGRQGPGGRTHLMSPEMAAAAAVAGAIADVREHGR